jgi:hypothetical protein
MKDFNQYVLYKATCTPATTKMRGQRTQALSGPLGVSLIITHLKRRSSHMNPPTTKLTQNPFNHELYVMAVRILCHFISFIARKLAKQFNDSLD